MTDPTAPSNEVEVHSNDDVSDAIAQLQQGKTALYSSIKGDDFKTRSTVLSAVMSSSALADNLDKAISLANVIVQPTEMLNERTGTFETQPRIILIDDKGAAFHAISSVLFRDIQNVLAILGEPHTWPSPVKVKVQREGTGNRKFFTLHLA